jgi:hypothetical protein
MRAVLVLRILLALAALGWCSALLYVPSGGVARPQNVYSELSDSANIYGDETWQKYRSMPSGLITVAPYTRPNRNTDPVCHWGGGAHFYSDTAGFAHVGCEDNSLPMFNLALGRPVAATAAAGGPASKANDGNIVASAPDCYESDVVASPFWEVDLQLDSTVRMVRLTSRADGCSMRLVSTNSADCSGPANSNFVVELRNVSDHVLQSLSSNAVVPLYWWHVNVTAVRKVRITFPHTNALTFGEFPGACVRFCVCLASLTSRPRAQPSLRCTASTPTSPSSCTWAPWTPKSLSATGAPLCPPR